jgi:hypothetical protein
MPSKSHLGQPPLNHVVLEVVGGMNGGCGPSLFDFVRLTPDGKSVPGAFRVPQGQLLIITDVDWQYVHPSHDALAGHIEVLRLFLQPIPAGQDPGVRVFESTVTLSTKGEGGISEGMTAGFVVSSHSRICPDVFPGPTGPPFGLQHLILRGYLLPAT